MANKRKLKKAINSVCGELFAECVATSLYSGKPEQDNVHALLTSILVIHNDFTRRVSHPEPGMKAKAYYKAIVADFNKQIAEEADQITNLG